jgi:copper chaperone CopZ
VRQVTLAVPSIHCAGCVGTLREELGKLPVVVAVDGDAIRKQLVVTVRDGPGPVREVEAAITRLGHVVGQPEEVARRKEA